MIESQERSRFGTESAVIHPKPSPEPSDTATTTPSPVAETAAPHFTSAISPSRPRGSFPAARQCSRATCAARKPSASTAGIFPEAPSPMSAAPRNQEERKPISRPNRTTPIMIASLWMPETRWKSTSGLTASQRAATGSTPARRARWGAAQMTRPSPTSASTRCR